MRGVFFLITREEFLKRQSYLLDGEEPPEIDSKNIVRSVPAGFKDWMKENKARIAKMKHKPYFVKDNEGFV